MAKHLIELTEPQLRTLNRLIIAEAARMGRDDYSDPSEFPLPLKKIAVIWRKLNAWRYDFLKDGTAVARGDR